MQLAPKQKLLSDRIDNLQLGVMTRNDVSELAAEARKLEARVEQLERTAVNYDTEAMAIALHEHRIYLMGGTPNWAALSPEKKTMLVSEAGNLIQRYITRSEERKASVGPTETRRWSPSAPEDEPMRFTINGKPHTTVAGSLSYEDVVSLSTIPHGPSRRPCTVTWTRSDGVSGGLLTPGQYLTLRTDTHFIVGDDTGSRR